MIAVERTDTALHVTIPTDEVTSAWWERNKLQILQMAGEA